MRKQLDKNYDPKLEDAIYERWLERGYFHAVPNPDKKPFTIVIPPPNITGQLHIGHALNNTVQDVLIRAKRMQGYEALWLPGTDHAAIATEVRIVQDMAKAGLTKDDLGRDGFMERAWAWKEKYGGTIINQLKKLGSSCDWERERFTMDEGLSDAVLEVFIRLYDEGKIYRGEKLVNWCMKCQTTISDAEVEHEDRDSQLYYFKYPITGTEEYISFATTRPETMLGDTAIAVSPSDERYANFIGQTVLVPPINREIPVIADEYVDPTFGTGVVKITPAHDPNDFEVGERHGLARISIFHDDGTVNANGGRYEGLTREAAREEIIREMDGLGLFLKKEPLRNAVGTHDRCGEVVEPLIKLQWFVSMHELAQPAIEAYKTGELRFNRERFGKVYLHWMENIKDWCISRQLWWGHRIPAYYCEHGHITVSKTTPATCRECGSTHLTQDEDTLDTWFSSALWPFSTLGWPAGTEDLEYFFPTNVLVTAQDIIFFWVARMVFMSLKFMGRLPFTDVFMTGMVRDSLGRKMSKSLDNGIDPLELVEQYGADALRLMLVSGNALDNDTRFFWERMDASRNFLNKLWNASRFVLMNLDDGTGTDEPVQPMRPVRPAPEALQAVDQWILSRMNRLVKDVTEKLDAFELGLAAQKIVDFIWDEFCDWYVEMVKPRLYGDKADPACKAALWTLRKVLLTAVKLLHPFTPFITETLFLTLQDGEDTVMLSDWPLFDAALDFPEAEQEIERVKEAVRGIRNIRTEKQVPPAKKIKVVVAAEDSTTDSLFTRSRAMLAFLSGASEVTVCQPSEAPASAVSVVQPGAVLYLPLDALIDTEKERERLNREKQKLMQELARVEGKLSNEGFLKKAPDHLVAEETAKREKFKAMLQKVEEQTQAL